MRHAGLMLMAALLSACAQAQVPKPIPDVEPDVTLQVGALLAQLGQGALPAPQLTDKAQAALGGQLAQIGAALRPCAGAPTLQLLSRNTKGEDRLYLYRALCHTTPLLLEVDFNKAAKINRLALRPETR